MYYTVYKTTNLINGKFYIGKHQTKDLNDDYMGSGKLIRRAFVKYGIENFSFEYLGIFDQEWKMNLAEKIYVVLDKEMSYNLCPGGQGGFGYLNTNRLNIYTRSLETKEKQKIILEKNREKQKYNRENIKGHTEKISKLKSISMKKRFENGYISTFVELNKDEDFQEKRKASLKGKQSGNKNSQYGTIWITNGNDSIKVPKDYFIPEGWYKGRKIKKEVNV